MPSRREEAPIQFRQWKPPGSSNPSVNTGTGTGEAADPFVSARSPKAKGSSGSTTKAAASGSSTPPLTIWNYRPGALLRKLRTPPAASSPSPAPATALAEPNDTLAHFFPTFFKDQADPGRVARARRPDGGDRPSGLAGRSTGSSPATVSAAPKAGGRGSILPAGILVQAYPKPPTPPEPTPRDPFATAAAAPAGAGLNSREPGHVPDLIDGLTTTTSLDVDAAPTPAPAPPSSSPESVADPEGRTTGGSLEPVTRAGELVPSRDVEPAVVASSDEADFTVRPSASPPPLVAPNRMLPVRATPSSVMTAALRSLDVPAPAGRPILGQARPIDLPPPEFPPTYHTESLRMTLREAAPSGRPTRPVSLTEPEPDRPLFPRLSKLWTRPRPDTDRALQATSARIVTPSPGQ